MPRSELLENAFIGDGFGIIFQAPDFFRLHSAAGDAYFEWADGTKAIACAHFSEVASGAWRSPAKGTFAGLAFGFDLGLERLAAFYDAVEERLITKGARMIEVLPSPEAHDSSAFANSVYLLRTRGFDISQCDLNYAIKVDERPLSARMSYGNRKRLQKCEREGIRAEQLPIAALPKAYETIVANRAMRNHAVSMTLGQLQSMADLFPDRMVLFGCSDDHEMIASAICLRVSPTVLYVFYWGDRPGYNAFSPVVQLANALYVFCQANGISVLDAGTSTIDSEPNYGLIGFKRGLGMSESLKVRMVKTL